MSRDPERLCVACRQLKPKSQLVRVVLCGGEILPDPTGRAPGRGAYLCRESACLHQALREGRLARSFKQQLSKEEEAQLLTYWDSLHERDPEARILNLIGLGRRGRLLVCGTQAVELSVRREHAQIVLLAADSAENTSQALTTLCTKHAVPCIKISDRETLGRLTGTAVRSAIAVTDPELSSGLLALLPALSQGECAEKNPC